MTSHDVYGKAIAAIRGQLKGYVVENGIKSLVIGISGGIDSALCAALARPVCDELRIPLIGRSLPTLLNKGCEVENAEKVGDAFCTDFNTVGIHAAAHQLMAVIEREEPGSVGEGMIGTGLSRDQKIRRGNVIARTRMIYLYNLASLHGGMVLSTDNLTEYLLGFWTLHGDCGDFGMIQNVMKTEVYEIARHIAAGLRVDGKIDGSAALEACIGCAVTDGLGVSTTSLEQLGAASYDEVDDVLVRHIVDKDEPVKDHPVSKRHEKSRFKRDNPHDIPRSDVFPDDDGKRSRLRETVPVDQPGRTLDEMGSSEQERMIDACFSQINIVDLFDADSVDVVPMDFRNVWWRKSGDEFRWADKKESLEKDDADGGGEILTGHFYKKGNYVLVHYKIYMEREEECIVVRSDREITRNEEGDEA